MAENRIASTDAIAPDTADECASAPPPAPPHESDGEQPDPLAFDPVPLRPRADGLTPERQREFVEALADTGLVRVAAARIGLTEQAVARARRRADARGFDLACEAARRIGARRLHDLAWERAIEGTVKQHFSHGELKGEERVYDNRLLTYLLGKTEPLLAPDPQAEAVARDWERWAEAIEQGLPEPAPIPSDTPPDAATEALETAPFDGSEVWEEEDGEWWTGFPPPAGFDGEEEGRPGEFDYKRTLSAAERAVIHGDEEVERCESLYAGLERRNLYFGFDRGGEEELFSPKEAETSKLPPRLARE